MLCACASLEEGRRSRPLLAFQVSPACELPALLPERL